MPFSVVDFTSFASETLANELVAPLQARKAMRIVDPSTGESNFRKRVDEPGHARELTFSCYKRFRFLNRDRSRQWFIDELQQARQKFPVDLWAYVIMPEHVHLLVYPREEDVKVGRFAGSL